MPSKLLLIGDGPERQSVEEQAREVCTENIRFLGKLDAIEEVLSVSDLFLITSEKESFGLAALEAMACEVPVISSNAGGLPELNKDGVSGFTCEVGDVEDMAKKAIHILDEANLRNSKTSALSRAKEFDINNILPKYEDFYEEIINIHQKTVTQSL